VALAARVRLVDLVDPADPADRDRLSAPEVRAGLDPLLGPGRTRPAQAATRMQSLIAFSSFGRAVSSLFLRLQRNVTMARKRNPTLTGVNTD